MINYQNQEINQKYDDSRGEKEENQIDEDEEEKKRNRRRSKNDNDGRNFKCENCGKAYLSYPALYTHTKTKHDMQGKSGKGRGRPKKDIGIVVNSLRLLYNPANFDFFKHPDRSGETTVNEIKDCMMQVFQDVYMRLRSKSEEMEKKIKLYDTIEDHPFLNQLSAFLKNPRSLDETAKCDEVFAFYIFKVAKYSRPDFFAKVLKFLLLFRECLNISYKDNLINKHTEAESDHANSNSSPPLSEYSEVFNPEDAPDISNEFVTDYLGTESVLMDFQREEAIDLTQNLCQWLYDNNFTCSKLSLINNC